MLTRYKTSGIQNELPLLSFAAHSMMHKVSRDCLMQFALLPIDAWMIGEGSRRHRDREVPLARTLLECGDSSPLSHSTQVSARTAFGVRWQAKRDTALDFAVSY